jgi:hypothetical protein
MKSLKEQYIKLLADSITVSVEDLQPNELSLIAKSFDLFSEKLDDLKIANDEIKRISIELANLKAMSDDTETNYDED